MLYPGAAQIDVVAIKATEGVEGAMHVSSIAAVHRAKHNKLGQTSIFKIVYLHTLLFAM